MTDLSLPSVIAGRYRILRELGRGGMGVVLLVEHMNTGDQLALKLLHAHAGVHAVNVDRFKREARASALIKSENVVRITDADVAPELGGAPFLVMELLDGCDIERWLEDNGPMPAPEVVRVLSQVALAMDRAHAAKIVHRDLKPENIFLHRTSDVRSMVKILDFGISKMLSSPNAPNDGNVSNTRTGAVMGTPLYMAPEQARGDIQSLGPAVDVWAFGLIAFRMLTNADYWKADSFALLIMAIVVSPLEPPSSKSPLVDARFDEWFFRCCNRDIGARFRTMGEAASELARVLGVAAARDPEAPLPVRVSERPAEAVRPATSETVNDMARTTLGTARSGKRAATWAVLVSVVVAVIVSVFLSSRASTAVESATPHVAASSVEVAPLPVPASSNEPTPAPPVASSAPVAVVVPPPPKIELRPRSARDAGAPLVSVEKPPEPAPFKPLAP